MSGVQVPNRIAGHLRVQKSRQHADDEIRRLDFVPTGLRVARVQRERRSGRVASAFLAARSGSRSPMRTVNPSSPACCRR